MTRYNLAIPFYLKDKLKTFKTKWDMVNKTWYWEGDKLIPELEKYEESIVDIEYDEKDEYKALFTSLKFDKNIKSWKCSREDLSKIEKYRKSKE